jgi:hypothetical protein
MDLYNIIGETDREASRFTLINSSVSDGSFLIHYLLSNKLKTIGNDLIAVVSFSQTFSHYKSIQAKLGNAKLLADRVNSNRFTFCEAFSLGRYDEVDRVSVQLDGVLDKVEKFRQASNLSSEPINIIVDDLSILMLIGVEEFQVMAFLKRLQNMGNVNLVLFSQRFDSFNGLFLNDLSYLVDRVINVERLETGYLKDVNGKVTF